MPIAAQASPTLDGDAPTLHLRCGQDIREILGEAGFGGDFLEVSDPLCQGPVPDQGDLEEMRAAFIADAYGWDIGAARNKLSAEREGLAEAGRHHRRVVLWFEHDSYDQFILARVLAHFADHPTEAKVELICADSFPGHDRFIGLGQLAPTELAALWPERQPVGEVLLQLSRSVWSALRAPEPTRLSILALTGTPELPQMAPALTRHLQELPWTGDGLSLTQRLILQQLTDRPRTIGEAFRNLQRETEPLPFLGDLMFLAIVREMAAARVTPFTVDADGQDWSHWRLQLTSAGHEIIAGRRDWMNCGAAPRWVGGVHLHPAAPQWRWNPQTGGPVVR